jgi:hypothetical protein
VHIRFLKHIDKAFILFFSITVFSDPIQRIREKKTARVPILHGTTQDDGNLFTFERNLTTFLETFPIEVDAQQIRAVYPGLNDSQLPPFVFRDFVFLWFVAAIACRWGVIKLLFESPAQLTTTAYVESGISNVFRYVYGINFPA